MRPNADVSDPSWQLDGMLAMERETGRPWAAEVAVDRPRRGIRVPAPSGAARLLGLDLAAGPEDAVIVPAECWVRGRDLVAVYEPRDERSMRATAMWRHWPTGRRDVAAWELVVSAQTSLLESDAAMAVVSDAADGEVLAAIMAGGGPRWRRLDACDDEAPFAVLVRCEGVASTLAAVHPSERHHIDVGRGSSSVAAADGRIEIVCRLFSSLVEKGVLLRGRTLGAIGPAEGDARWADELLSAFVASPPVLTA